MRSARTQVAPVRIRLKVNGRETWVESAGELRRALGEVASERFKEIWLAMDPAPSLCALLNGNLGWLMYMRSPDEGLQSINPDFTGDPNGMREYLLSNGQMDEYPESWAIAEAEIVRALEYFVDHGQPAPFVVWRDW